MIILQGTTGRPGARFGPGGIRQGSRRIEPGGYSIYTGKLQRMRQLGDVRKACEGMQSTAAQVRYHEVCRMV
jgi:arginase family enzyme